MADRDWLRELSDAVQTDGGARPAAPDDDDEPIVLTSPWPDTAVASSARDRLAANGPVAAPVDIREVLGAVARLHDAVAASALRVEAVVERVDELAVVTVAELSLLRERLVGAIEAVTAVPMAHHEHDPRELPEVLGLGSGRPLVELLELREDPGPGADAPAVRGALTPRFSAGVERRTVDTGPAAPGAASGLEERFDDFMERFVATSSEVQAEIAAVGSLVVDGMDWIQRRGATARAMEQLVGNDNQRVDDIATMRKAVLAVADRIGGLVDELRVLGEGRREIRSLILERSSPEPPA